jgi:hypothetical protein
MADAATVPLSHRRPKCLLDIGRPTTASPAAPLQSFMLSGQFFTIAEALRFGASIVVVSITTAAISNIAPLHRKAWCVGCQPACLSERANGVAGL